MSGQVPEVRILKFGFSPITDAEIQSLFMHLGNDITKIDSRSSSTYLRREDRGESWEAGSMWYAIGYLAFMVSANTILVEQEHLSQDDLNSFIEGFGGDLSPEYFIGLFTSLGDNPPLVTRIAI